MTGLAVRHISNDDGDAFIKIVDAALARLERHIQSTMRTITIQTTTTTTTTTFSMHNVHERRNSGGVKAMLRSLRTELPRQYLHIPPHFHVDIDGTKVPFQHWEPHLVELHHFFLCILIHKTYLQNSVWLDVMAISL